MSFAAMVMVAIRKGEEECMIESIYIIDYLLFYVVSFISEIFLERRAKIRKNRENLSYFPSLSRLMFGGLFDFLKFRTLSISRVVGQIFGLFFRSNIRSSFGIFTSEKK